MYAELKEIGVLIDELTRKLYVLDSEVEVDLKKLEVIEKRINTIDYNKLKNDEKITYNYTHSNFLMLILELFKYEMKPEEHLVIMKNENNIEEFIFSLKLKAISMYREALELYDSKSKIHPLFIAQIETNLSNIYCETERYNESYRILKDSLKKNKNFAMAEGNIAIKLFELSKNCHEPEKAKKLVEKSVLILEEMLARKNKEYIEKDQINTFQEWCKYIKKELNVKYKNVGEPVSVTSDSQYKAWCSEKGLMLDYLNFVDDAHHSDDLHLPDLGVGSFADGSFQKYFSWLNAMKQEFNLARYFLYQTEMSSYVKPHESQELVKIVNTLNYPAMGYRTELLKSALRCAYGILDKIGFICNEFYGLDLNVNHIDFHGWYRNIDVDVALDSPFKSLYWLSRDLDRKEGYHKDMRTFRNVLEHRFLEVLEYYDIDIKKELEDEDKAQYMVSYADLDKMVRKTLFFVMDAIFYVVNGIYHTKLNFMNYATSDKSFVRMEVFDYQDIRKN